jgi:SulP family sulfate permease
MKFPWRPKLIDSLRDYSPQKFLADLMAGLTVGLVALPLAMAFAISSGVTPERGLYCAVVAGFLISALGGSRVQIGGPTGAFVVIVAGIVAVHGVDGLLICTMMAGVILVLLGVTGLGSAVRFVPRPVVIGFTNGIAVLIASTQIKDFFGLRIESVPSQFVPRMKVLFENASSASLSAALLAAGTIGVIVLCRTRFKRVPGAIAALAIGTLAAVLLRLPVETIGSRFGGVPSGLPTLALPRISLHDLTTLFSPALTVALLGAIESLMSAVVADRMSGDKHDPNTELVAQGLANIASPLFGGLPATGAIARTATNIRSGAISPVSGMVHALTLLAVLLFAAPMARYIPLPVLAGILTMVAYNMGEWREVPKILKLTSAEVAVWLATFCLTVFADLTVAVEVGLVLAALVYIRNVTGTTTVSAVTQEYVDDTRSHVLHDKFIPDCVTVVRIHGPFLFGATDKIAPFLERVDEMSAIVILRLRNMTAIDATGLMALEDFAHKLQATGRTLILCGALPQPAQLLRQAKFEEHVVGPGNVCANIAEALERAEVAYFSHLFRPAS